MSIGPTFLGIGAPKCGTTWLYAQLKSHPEIWLTPHKEMHYFDRAETYQSPSRLAQSAALTRLTSVAGWREHEVARGFGKTLQAALKGNGPDARFWWNMTVGQYDDAWYRSLFPASGHYKATGEITPAYCMLTREDVLALHAINPDLRLIYLLRNPVDRAWSSLRYNTGRKTIDLDLSDVPAILETIDGDERGGRGDYLHCLDVFSQVFDPSQILVGFYDAIITDPGDLLSAVASHIGVDPQGFRAATDVRVNPSQAREIPTEVKAALIEKYRAQIEGVIERIGGRARSWLDEAPVEGPVAQPLGG